MMVEGSSSWSEITLSSEIFAEAIFVKVINLKMKFSF